MRPRRIGFYGGSFDPPHCGHQATILYAMECADLDELIVAPVYSHPDGKPLAPFGDRMAMVNKLVEPFASRYFSVQVSRIEEVTHAKGSEGLTCRTLRYLFSCPNIVQSKDADGYGCDDVIVLVLGSDIRGAIEKWRGYDEVKEFVDAGRVEFLYVDRVHGSSSTEVRRRIRAGESIANLVPTRVRRHIEQCELYREPLRKVAE